LSHVVPFFVRAPQAGDDAVAGGGDRPTPEHVVAAKRKKRIRARRKRKRVGRVFLERLAAIAREDRETPQPRRLVERLNGLASPCAV
jgi:MoxR-like ATPase